MMKAYKNIVLHTGSCTTQPVRRFCTESAVFPESFTPTVLNSIMDRLRKYPRVVLKKDPNNPPRRAAVLVCLVNWEGKSAMLFTKRPDTMRTHSGQVSFPGGGEEAEDGGDLIATALRETQEEIGIPKSDVQVLGLFNECISLHGIIVTPVIGFLGNFNREKVERLQKSADEIDTIFHVTLENLTGPNCRVDEKLGRGTIARFINCPFPIWGLTGYITDHVLKKLLSDLPDVVQDQRCRL